MKHDYALLGVVTQPDRGKGRGRQPMPSPIKVLAESNGLPVWQPERVRDESFLAVLREMAPDVIVVAAFGQILPREVLEAPPWGCLNVHPSLLPRYRGAAPLNWTLIRGEEITGVTIMVMDAGVDTGDILLQAETPVAANETFDHLHDRLAAMGARLLLQALQNMEAGTAVRRVQEDAQATYAPRLQKEDGLIRWQARALDIARLVRGLSSTPGAYTMLAGKTLRIFMAEAEEGPMTEAAGTVVGMTEKGLRVTASDGHVLLQDVQLEGKKRMPIQDFLRGYRLPDGARLG